MTQSLAMRRKSVESWGPDEPPGTFDVRHVVSTDGEAGNILHFRCMARRHCSIAESPFVTAIAPDVQFTVHLGPAGVTVLPVVDCPNCGWRGYIIKSRMAAVARAHG